MNAVNPSDARSLKPLAGEEPRFRLPARFEFGASEHVVLEWGRDGLTFEGKHDGLSVGSDLDGALRFDLPGGPLRCAVRATVVATEADADTVSVIFHGLAAESAAAVEFVIQSYLAGRIIVMNGGLAKGEQLRKDGAAAGASSRVALNLQRIAGLALVTLIGAVALYYLTSSAYERLFLFDATAARVAFPVTEIDAPIAGTVGKVAAIGAIAAGATLFTISDNGGTETPVASPCTCQIVSIDKAEGGFVSAGGSVVKLANNDAPASIEVSVPFALLGRVSQGAAADLKYLDGTSVSGANILGFKSMGNTRSNVVQFDLEPGRSLSPVRYGEPVSVTFDTAPWRRQQ